ncbi:MAG: Uma2 family endonuclease, partial [Planctomycetaceae bacterium]|nr:Uma2 family endonuclease [Planctomycetaceae bacterium]
LLTAEEYASLDDLSGPTELVRGEIVELNPPKPEHGLLCTRVGRLLDEFAERQRLGWVFLNDTGVIIDRNPDTVRGPDVWFVGYEKLPVDTEFSGRYLELVPDLAVEILSPSNRRGETIIKVGEYLRIGVSAVCVLDATNQTVHLFSPDQPDTILQGDDIVEFRDVLPGFRISVRELFRLRKERQQ